MLPLAGPFRPMLGAIVRALREYGRPEARSGLPMQALARRHPSHVGHRGALRYEYEYRRRGTCSLLAAFDVLTGKVLGRVSRGDS